MDSCLGHQGSSATYPSSKWDVHKDHLRNHGGRPHNPQNCIGIVKRSVDEVEALYNENLCEDRQTNDTRKTGKFHGNFFHRFVFPIKSLDFVVPPILHIMLGIVLKLFNLLLERCREIDSSEGYAAQCEEAKEQKALYDRESEKLRDLEKKCRTLGCDYVDLYNFKERLEAALSGNFEEIDAIASASDSHSKRRVKKVESCTGLKCLISGRDEDIFWILCSSCEEWKHGLCEALTQTEMDTHSVQTCLLYTSPSPRDS